MHRSETSYGTGAYLIAAIFQSFGQFSYSIHWSPVNQRLPANIADCEQYQGDDVVHDHHWKVFPLLVQVQNRVDAERILAELKKVEELDRQRHRSADVVEDP